ncbi:unnamed protein product, partial [Allacma fusca]
MYMKVQLRSEETTQNEDLRRQLHRELYRFQARLPALAARAEIEKHVESNRSRFLIIQGQTGSGKSTQVVQYVADHPKLKNKKVVCTQPRKLAAISLASRVAMEYSGGSSNSSPGHEVRYYVGGDKLGGKGCRIEFVTEKVMLDRIMKGCQDAFNDVGCIVLDEAHERSILCDILLGLFREEDPRWKDLKIIVTSATIDLQEFSEFFKQAPTVEIEGRTYPVEFIYNPVQENCEIHYEVVKCALEIHQTYVLTAKVDFEDEVSKLNSPELLETLAFSLYGRQEPEEQFKVFEKLPATNRKIIFATDVAETSITINGIVYVVDSGIKKEMVFDPKRNISTLQVKTISRSSAIQRAGRSGRIQPGKCYRLYSKDDFELKETNTPPEIFRRPLSLAILCLREMKIDPVTFGWISAPSTDAFAAADEELRYLKAVDENNRPTDLGKLIAQSQHEPKLVRMIYRSCQDGLGMAGVTVASLLTIAHLFFWNGTDAAFKQKKLELPYSDGDIVTMFRLFEKWLRIRSGKERDPKSSRIISNEIFVGRRQNAWTKQAVDWCRMNFINGKAMRLAMSTRDELLALFAQTDIWRQNGPQNKEPSNEQLRKIVFYGYFLHSARLIHSRNARNHEYCAIHPDVIGNLSSRAAILKGKDSQDFSPPNWIIYDRVLRLPSTLLFPVTSPIESSWINEENEEFYELCTRKCDTLPTETIFKQTSQECLNRIVGKNCCNLNSLEKELNCALDVDVESGILAAYCSVSNKNAVEKALT